MPGLRSIGVGFGTTTTHSSRRIAMTTQVAAATPTIEDMVQRAQSLLPALRARAMQTEALGRLLDETVKEFSTGGFFRVLQPRRFGGYELDYGRLQTALCSVIGQACGS